MSDLSGTCAHGVSRAKPCGECMGEGFQKLIDAMNDPATHGGVRGGYAQLFDKIIRLESENESLKRERAMLVDLRYELMGIAADVDSGNGFDVVCRKTLQRVIDNLSATEPQATQASPESGIDQLTRLT